MEQMARITPAQYEVLNMLSCIDKEEDVAALKTVIVQEHNMLSLLDYSKMIYLEK